MDRLFVLDMPALKNFEADGKIIEYICDHFSKYNCDKVERTNDLSQYGANKGIYKVIPISSIEHTEQWLQKNYEKKMQPIELPYELQPYSPGYQQVSGDYILQNNFSAQEYFIKQTNKFKGWRSDQWDDDINQYIESQATYAIVPRHKIYAEYRFFIYKDEVIGVTHYSGSPLIFPDTKLIEKMIKEYNKTDSPEAYTLDIAITEIGTIPLEVHPFVACGLYGFQDLKLLDMWEKGLDWYIKKEGR